MIDEAASTESTQACTPYNSWMAANGCVVILFLLFLGDVEPVFKQRLIDMPLPVVTESLLFLGRHWSWIFLGAIGFAILGCRLKPLRKHQIQIPVFLCLAAGLVYCLVSYYLPLHSAP
jgi:hypothetical protein